MKIPWLFLVLAVGTTSPVFADKHPSAAQVKAWVEEGRVVSLESILQRHKLGGELLDAEIEWEDAVLTYELKWLDTQGRRHETYVDAHTGALIKTAPDDH
jgi:uncharacterized membrane protein YkoI